MIMEERIKYILIGIIIGIVTGVAVFYLLLNLGIIRPFGLRGFMRPGNFTNFTGPFRGG